MTLAQSLARLQAQEPAWDEAIHPGTLTIGSSSYAASVIIRDEPLSLETAGLRSRDVLIAWVRKSLLTTAPEPGTAVTCMDRQWIVQQVSGTETHAIEWRITCIP